MVGSQKDTDSSWQKQNKNHNKKQKETKQTNKKQKTIGAAEEGWWYTTIQKHKQGKKLVLELQGKGETS